MQLTKINGKYELWLPDHRAARPEWKLENGGWEVARIEEMLNGKHGCRSADVVFDIGTEEGDISALLQKYGDVKMVLFEPNDRVWPCIKDIWEANDLADPLHFIGAFLSSNHKPGNFFQWNAIDKFNIIPDHGFKQLYENYPDVPQITLDMFCKETGIYPDIITMDVEGSEFEVIKGAEKTLREIRPVIFMSVHPEFMYESYRNEGEWKEKYGERQHVVHMLRFIDELGYTHRCIEYDYHELHMVFEPK
jgi:FkbM family methyltransferase